MRVEDVENEEKLEVEEVLEEEEAEEGMSCPCEGGCPSHGAKETKVVFIKAGGDDKTRKYAKKRKYSPEEKKAWARAKREKARRETLRRAAFWRRRPKPIATVTLALEDEGAPGDDEAEEAAPHPLDCAFLFNE